MRPPPILNVTNRPPTIQVSLTNNLMPIRYNDQIISTQFNSMMGYHLPNVDPHRPPIYARYNHRSPHDMRMPGVYNVQMPNLMNFYGSSPRKGPFNAPHVPQMTQPPKDSSQIMRLNMPPPPNKPNS
ncbi:hypothetical protein RF11_00058 [Thelohanellus kitauei]|uniref:Uncharacterized protein n=1 Tax=Thelohanellus kitauei TaxID=669202 RepID=A0A0C2NJ83_THEKT|nr:hypothetical protein RF11_00058 [Thelohanellus kitauei]